MLQLVLYRVAFFFRGLCVYKLNRVRKIVLYMTHRVLFTSHRWRVHRESRRERDDGGGIGGSDIKSLRNGFEQCTRQIQQQLLKVHRMKLYLYSHM